MVKGCRVGELYSAAKELAGPDADGQARLIFDALNKAWGAGWSVGYDDATNEAKERGINGNQTTSKA